MDDDSAKTTEQLCQELANLRQQRAVEQAAERIREHVLAMRTSEALYPLAATFLTEVRNLGINTSFLSIAFIKNGEIVNYYIADVNWTTMGLDLREECRQNIEEVTDEAVVYDFRGDQAIERMDENRKKEKIRAHQTQQVGYLKANKANDSDLRHQIREDLLEDWMGAENDVEKVVEILIHAEKYSYQVPFRHGVVAFSDLRDNENSVETVRTLAKSFSLGYLRFLDFERLEQQNQQARLEAAVQRVRAEVQAMHTSDDLYNVVAILWRQMLVLGIETEGCNIDFINEETGYVDHYYTFYNNEISRTWDDHREIDQDTVAMHRIKTIDEVSGQKWAGIDIIDQWRKGEAYSIEVDSDQPHYPGVWIVTNIPFRFGFIGIRERTHSAEHIELVKELARAVELGYLRFLDFQQLEQQYQDLQKAQEALVRSESLAAIGTLAAGAAHELNNPMGAAASLVQTVQEMAQEDSDEEWAEDRAMIVEHLAFSRKELDRAKAIVASLLGLARQSQDYTEAVDLQTVAQDALRGLHGRYDAEKVAIEEDYQTDLPVVQGNFSQLVQVALNLINNAVDVLGDDRGTVELKTYTDGDQIVLECQDTGAGMTDEVRQDIFKPFFTTKAPGEGTGLGLYVCHQIIDKHGGTIEVDSAEGQGTTVRVQLPISKG